MIKSDDFPKYRTVVHIIEQLFSKQDSRESIATNMVNALIKARIEISMGKYWNPGQNMSGRGDISERTWKEIGLFVVRKGFQQ